ncbi:MAG: MAPEG family protein [Pseudobdellovibrio sp.]|nr:MAPEG family protein [Pseudobdellovibrio sp.]
MRNELILPMAIYMFYMAGLAVYLFLSRYYALKNREVGFKYFQTYNVAPPPDKVLVIGRHYDNNFQVPLLFFVSCLAHMMIGSVNMWTVGLAWFFVASRFFHSFVHLGSNKVHIRVIPFGLGWLAIILMWVQLLVFAM